MILGCVLTIYGGYMKKLFSAYLILQMTLLSCFFISTNASADENAQPYIKIGEAKTKKSLLAMPPFQT